MSKLIGNNRIGVVIISVVVITLLIIYALFDPSLHRWFPQCVFYKLTGWQCAGCGSQRAIHALLKGDFVGAWHQNALLVLLIPVILFMIYLEIVRIGKPKLYSTFYSPYVIWIFVVVIVVWTILRNLI